MQVYSDPDRENETWALPDVEVFYADQFDVDEWNDNDGLSENNGDTLYTPGWYRQSCFPGCLPDSDPIGPFATEEEAIADAQRDS